MSSPSETRFLLRRTRDESYASIAHLVPSWYFYDDRGTDNNSTTSLPGRILREGVTTPLRTGRCRPYGIISRVGTRAPIRNGDTYRTRRPRNETHRRAIPQRNSSDVTWYLRKVTRVFTTTHSRMTDPNRNDNDKVFLKNLVITPSHQIIIFV